MTSFADVFRPSLQAAALMAEYQDGLFEDVRAYMADFRRHAREHTETKPQGYEVTIYPSRLHDGPAFGLNCSDLLLGKLARQCTLRRAKAT
ncbi:hypothetical protein SPRG_16418 [Saprolegnia parasitica CBS 223.65]|uniref:Uncharacterized protein n=1 Tax=Saprolegnia parasitica (strain CBS 223.65) TaxID=695850 RepID=A0A067BIA5_SAPPC|nr:hypothetical protein SPRG_16418 [Saprolegnia parasitica CBS 223.65]KDO18129.1 hypothetical protein SPRG_16418 [Saprolegnia parasitica CBS 223.65]|eukprot:XP_012211165.1 hypothetical protein SPRG_16418 [Saprolegnia parasitica CBS 223.65]